MARIDFITRRLFVEPALQADAEIALDRMQSNYLCNVLRLDSGAELLVFNGRDGEWRARLERAGRAAHLVALHATRPQPAPSRLDYLFAPLKQARLDYLVQKATEMGAGRLRPIMTQHVQVPRLNVDRLRANVVEAAEQCGVLALPQVEEPVPFAAALANWPASRPLVVCDEDAPVADPLAALRALPPAAAPGLVIGPEGGFSATERAALLARPEVIRLSLGPRILRADTAAVAALALLQAVAGDWRAADGDHVVAPLNQQA